MACLRGIPILAPDHRSGHHVGDDNSSDLMPLFWLVHEIDGTRRVRIQEGGAMIFARLNAMIDGFGGTFVEAPSA